LVKQLLKMGADPNVQDNAEWSPLHEACNRGNLSVVKVLKEFGADLNLMGFGRGNFYVLCSLLTFVLRLLYGPSMMSH
jgi:ankyrin repeat protein